MTQYMCMKSTSIENDRTSQGHLSLKRGVKTLNVGVFPTWMARTCVHGHFEHR